MKYGSLVSILFYYVFSCQDFGEGRSINIVVSHQYKYAVDEYKEQSEVDLEIVKQNIKQELINRIKSYSKLLQTGIANNKTRDDKVFIRNKPLGTSIIKNKTRDGKALIRNKSLKTSIINNKTPDGKEFIRKPTKKETVPHIIDLLYTGTTINTPLDTPHPPSAETVRQKRDAHLAQLANQNVQGSPMHVSVNKNSEWTDFEVVSDEDLVRGRRERMKKVLEYIGITLAAVVGFSVIAVCFLTDPKTCIIAFGTGSPCCLIICPCVLACFKKFLTPGAIVKDNTNKYIPGIMVHPDGTLETYDPTPEEIEAVKDIIDIIQNMV